MLKLLELGMGIEPIYNSSAGSNNIDLEWDRVEQWLYNRLSKSYAKSVLYYAKRYYPLLNNLKQVNLIPSTNKNNVIKSLILLSKYLGIYDKFRADLKKYGITMNRQDCLQSFLRMFNANGNSDLNEWLTKANTVLKRNEQLFLKFAKITGIRMAEAVNSFNLILELHRENKLNDYYDKSLNVLMHFKYPKMFIRNTKNCYISFVPETLLNEIVNSETLDYNAIHNNLHKNNLKSRISELRDMFGSYLIHHQILQQEIDLLQGRIPPSVFIKYYWTPRLAELRDRIFKALEELN